MSIQLNFALRTAPKIKTVHLAGSWDNYAGKLPLSRDSSKSGGWKGTFKFQGTTLQQGQRYWYYVSCLLSIQSYQRDLVKHTNTIYSTS